MDWDVVAKWGPFALSALVIPVARWAVKAGLVTKEDFDDYKRIHRGEHEKLESRLNAGEVEFAKLDERLKHLPTDKDVDELRDQVAELSGDVKALTATIDAMGRTSAVIAEQLQMLVHHHLKGATK